MNVNSVSNHHNAHRSTSARTEESSSRQEQAQRAGTVPKERNDTFERKPFNINGKIGNGQRVSYGGHISSDFGKSSVENTSKQGEDSSEKIYGSGVMQYEKTATASPVNAQESKAPSKNSEKIDALIQELFKEPASEERNAKISKLHLYRATEVLKERGIAVVSDNKYADYLNGTESAAEYLKRTANATESETPVSKPRDEVVQEFTANATSFLADAAAKILNGAEGASLSSLGVNSSDFVQQMLDSFSTHYHSVDEVSTLMKQSEDLIKEFAAQISNGQEPNFNSLVTELTINGENTTIGQLLTH